MKELLNKGWVRGFLVGLLLNYLAFVSFHGQPLHNNNNNNNNIVSFSFNQNNRYRWMKTSNKRRKSQTTAYQKGRRYLENENENQEEAERDEYHDYEDHDGYWEELEDELGSNAEFVTCIVLFLIALTIGFEWFKHHLEETVTEDMEPIIEKLFAEMTVLGFLSMVTFFLNEGGFFEWLSVKIFGESEEEEELLEVFEVVHFAIFFIMLFFFVQVVVLIRQALRTEAQWLELDKDYRRPVQHTLTDTVIENDQNGFKKLWMSLRHSNTFLTLLPYFRNKHDEEEVNRAFFKALRDEFILERNTEPPFEPSAKNLRLKHDFIFGRYLGLSLVGLLARIVDVGNVTLLLFALLTIILYVWGKIMNEDDFKMAWSWLAIGWAILMFNVSFERHVLEIRRKLVPRNSPHLSSMVNSFDYGEVGEEDMSLPAWCSVDLKKYNATRSTFNKVFIAGKPNRQETLYWLDRYGKEWYAILLQTNLIFIGVDCAMQFSMFLPLMVREAPMSQSIPYGILTMLSILGNMLNKKHLISNLAVVSSVGCYRSMKVISEVFREQKTENLVRCFLIIYRLRRFAHEAQIHPKEVSREDENYYTKKLDPLEILEVTQTFKSFSHDREALNSAQFKSLMSTLGGEVSDEALKKMISTMDLDGDGNVSQEEFLQWYSDNMIRDDSSTLRDAPRVLFQLFDQDKNGELTISQFKTKLDALRVGFSVDEQIAIVNELDRRGNGTISQYEFELLFRKFPPTELRSIGEKFEYFPGELCSVATCHAFV